MNHRSLSSRGLAWAVVRMLFALLPLAASADQDPLQDKIDSFWASALYQAPRIDTLNDLEQERIAPPPEQSELARRRLPQLLGGERMPADQRRPRLYEGRLQLGEVPGLRLMSPDTLSWRQLHLASAPEAPAWLVDYLAEEIKKLSMKGRTRKPEPLAASRGRQEVKWGPLRDAQTDRVVKAADALAFAGPVTIEGAAAGRKAQAGTIVRVPLSASLVELDDWLSSRDYAMTLSLRRDAPIPLTEPVVIDGRLEIPAWIVSPRGLHPATLMGFAAGGADSCSNSHWMELRLGGDPVPEIWAVLLLAHPDMAKEAIVKRVPDVRPDEGNGERHREELEVRWADNRFEPLRITARRYDVTFSDYVEESEGKYVKTWSEAIGSAWKVEVRAQPDGKPLVVSDRYADGYVAPLSSTGTPKCPPR